MHSGIGQSGETWASGAAYEAYVGRWSRLVAREVLAWMAVPHGSSWLDGGCGTGALSETILALASPGSITGIDTSAAHIAYAQNHVSNPRVHFRVGDMQALPFSAATFDAAVSGLVLNFVPDKRRAALELARVVRPGGMVVLYVWDYAGKMELMRYFWDAVVALDPTSAVLDEGRRFLICQPDPLVALFQGAGLQAVAVRAIEVPTVFRDFDDYWSPFLGGQGPAPEYVASLGNTTRAALRERLRAALPVSADGSISLMARAWAVRGVV